MSKVWAAPLVAVPDPAVSSTGDEHQRAFTEISFLLDAFAATLGDIMGGATASVGRGAGRHMARELPSYLPDPTLETVLGAVAERLKKGFEITTQRAGNGEISLHFGRCAIRNVCQARQKTVGGELCRIFHCYLDGVVCELHCRPVRSAIVSCDGSCRIRLETK